jgi:diguanylate cyclase (GGDEF)-like protein
MMISTGLTVLGATLLAVSLYPTTRILRELPSGPVKTRWEVLRGFIVLFIAGYLVCLVLFSRESGTSHLVVSGIFLLGAVFVLLVCLLAHGTVRDVRRIATLESENITDPLMGIYNRRHLERRLEEEFARARRYGFPLSLLLLDIDHFKKVNDRYGHAAGDLVLKGVGALLKESLRAVDVPARYGGEEAVVLLPHTRDAEAAILAERIRGKIGSHPFPAGDLPFPGDAVRCTVSIGIAGMTPECKEAAQLLRMADTAMYRAKQEGRNRTVVFRCEREVPPAAAGAEPPRRDAGTLQRPSSPGGS